jgi:hypothetical protein
MKNKEEIKKMVNEVFPDIPVSEKKYLIKQLSPETRIKILKDTISLQKRSIDLIEPLVMANIRCKKGGASGGKKSGAARREKIKSAREAWQAEAVKIWRKHPQKSKLNVAQVVSNRIGGNPDYIRKNIQKPLP